jgi:predicted site-specific integrase-resolvase
MTPLCVAIYARVSSEQQATSNTIDSQIAALEARLTQDGLCLTPEGHVVAGIPRVAPGARSR